LLGYFIIIILPYSALSAISEIYCIYSENFQVTAVFLCTHRILTPRRHLWPCFNIWRFRRPLASLTWRDPTASYNWR